MNVHLYAEIAVAEWGEPDRYQTIGPFVPVESATDVDDALAALEDNLRRQGDDVIRVWAERDGEELS
jgi:hypothetical protein